MFARQGVGARCVMGWLVVAALTVPRQFAEQQVVAPALRPVEPSRTLEQVIMEAALQYQIHPALIAAMIEVESGYRPGVRSPKGAMGLMQLMPKTARHVGVAAPYDVAANVFGGVKYFRELLDQFRGNYLLALAAYNAGPEAVHQYGTIPPYPETIQYLPKVAYWYRQYNARLKKAYGLAAAPARSRRAAATIADKAGRTSSQRRVFSPQSGLTQS